MRLSLRVERSEAKQSQHQQDCVALAHNDEVH